MNSPAPFSRVVVQEASGKKTYPRIVFHLSHEHLAGIPRADDEYPFLPHRSKGPEFSRKPVDKSRSSHEADDNKPVDNEHGPGDIDKAIEQHDVRNKQERTDCYRLQDANEIARGGKPHDPAVQAKKPVGQEPEDQKGREDGNHSFLKKQRDGEVEAKQVGNPK